MVRLPLIVGAISMLGIRFWGPSRAANTPISSSRKVAGRFSSARTRPARHRTQHGNACAAGKETPVKSSSRSPKEGAEQDPANPTPDQDPNNHAGDGSPVLDPSQPVVEELSAAVDDTQLSQKEEEIRERFGTVRRHGIWLPAPQGNETMPVYITTGSLTNGRVNTPYFAQLNVEGGTEPYTWTIVDSHLPAPFTRHPDTGAISGTPQTPSVTPFFIQVTDQAGATDIAEYTLIIEPEEALRILTETLPSSRPGANYNALLQASGGIPPYHWDVSGNLEAAGSFVFDVETGILRGTIGDLTHNLDITLLFSVEDQQRVEWKELVLRIRTTITILNTPETPISQGKPWTFLFQAAGGSEPYTWFAETTLPPGLTLSADGTLSGKPTQAGTFPLVIWVEDATGWQNSVGFDLDIAAHIPERVTGFEALLSRTKVALRWNPVGNSTGVRIVRTENAPPTAPDDGALIYSGGGTACTDENLDPGTFYYAAFLDEPDTSPPTIQATLPPQTDPFADAVQSREFLLPYTYNSILLPGIVLGPPKGTGLERGSKDVVSIGCGTNDDDGQSEPYGGVIVLEFTDNTVWNGPGPDFTIFENVFYIRGSNGHLDPETRFMEPAVVAVSQDGITFREFPCNFSPRYDDTGVLNLRHPFVYNQGFAGVNPILSNGYDPDPTDPYVSGGDSFDLGELGLDWIRYIRIESTGNRAMLDNDGDLIHHTEEFGAASRSSNSGFDLDSVAAIWIEKVTESP